MMNQTDLKGKLTGVKGRFKDVLNKLTHKSRVNTVSNQADGTVDGDTSLGNVNQFEPSTAAQTMVRDNENASAQDKSYAFDEETTDVDYDIDDDFEDEGRESDDESGQVNRYS